MNALKIKVVLRFVEALLTVGHWHDNESTYDLLLLIVDLQIIIIVN